MRHLFGQSASVLLLTHFVIQPAAFRLLIRRARGPLFFRARQWSTGRAVPVATIAPPADLDLSMTTFAVEDPAIWFGHPEAPRKGLYRGQAEERCSSVSIEPRR